MRKGRGLRPFLVFVASLRRTIWPPRLLVRVPAAESVAPAVPKCFMPQIVRMSVVDAMLVTRHWPITPVLCFSRRSSRENQEATQRDHAQNYFTNQRFK